MPVCVSMGDLKKGFLKIILILPKRAEKIQCQVCAGCLIGFCGLLAFCKEYDYSYNTEVLPESTSNLWALH